MARARSLRLTSLLALAALPALAGLGLADTFTPLSTPVLEPVYQGPGITGPGIPSVVVRVPTVEAAGVCHIEACDEPVVVEEQGAELPGIAGVGMATPSLGIAPQCAPQDLACVRADGVPAQDLGRTPDLAPQTVRIDPVAAPAPCALAPDACAAQFTIPGTEQATPALAPIQVVPDLEVRGSIPGIAVVLETDQPEFGHQGPLAVPLDAPILGHVDVQLCSRSCPVPAAPDVPVRASGEAKAQARIGDRIVELL